MFKNELRSVFIWKETTDILMSDIDDKLKAGAKAVANKVDEGYRDLTSEYQREKYEAATEDPGGRSEIERDAKSAADKIEAGAKAVANKADDTYRDLKTEYRKEKIKAKFD